MYDIFEQLLKERRVTAYRVAKETGISTATLTQWKNGTSIPKQDKLQKIADYFGITLDYLVGNASETTPESETERKIRILTWKSEQLNDAEREEVLKHFENTIDLYLKAKGLEKRDEK
jgi:transcriptional regulator with XRE-family HTH domain